MNIASPLKRPVYGQSISMKKPEKKYYDYEIMPMGAGDLSPSRNPHFERCIEALAEIKDGRVIEIGCGGGQFIRLISSVRKELKYFGTDISKQAIAISSRKANGIMYCVSDAANLPFKQNSFDMVVAVDVFEHIYDVKKTLDDIHLVLKDGGIVFAYVPCEAEPFTLFWFFNKIKIGNNIPTKHFGHIQRFTKKSIESIIAESGFKIIEKKYADHLASQVISFFIWILPKEILSWFGDEAIKLGAENYEYRAEDSSKLTGKVKFLFFIKRFWIKHISSLGSWLNYYQNKYLVNVGLTARGLYIKCKKN